MSKAVDGTGAVEKVVAIVNEVRRVPTTGPNGEPNQALLATQASLRLVTSKAQARLRLSSVLLTYGSD